MTVVGHIEANAAATPAPIYIVDSDPNILLLHLLYFHFSVVDAVAHFHLYNVIHIFRYAHFDQPSNLDVSHVLRPLLTIPPTIIDLRVHPHAIVDFRGC